MTAHQKQGISWLEYQSQRTGKTVEELRQEMRERSALASRKNSGFASLTPTQRREVAQKGYKAGIGKTNNEKNSQNTSKEG